MDAALLTMAAEINAEHRLVEGARDAFLRRCLAVGQHLLETKKVVVEKGLSWPKWVEEYLEMDRTTANAYVRGVSYAEMLEGNAGVITSVETLRIFLRGLPRLDHLANRRCLSPDEEQAIVFRHSKGVTATALAREYGVSIPTIRAALDPSVRSKKAAADRSRDARRREAKRIRLLAKRLKDNTTAVKVVGGSVETAYSQIRRLLSTLDGAIASSENRAVAAALREAMAHVHSAEDDIVRAAKLSWTESQP